MGQRDEISCGDRGEGCSLWAVRAGAFSWCRVTMATARPSGRRTKRPARDVMSFATNLMALGVSMMVVAGCATTLLAQSPLSGDGARKLFRVVQPPPAPVPPNASRVTATVLEYSIWPPSSLQNLCHRQLPAKHALNDSDSLLLFHRQGIGVHSLT